MPTFNHDIDELFEFENFKISEELLSKEKEYL